MKTLIRFSIVLLAIPVVLRMLFSGVISIDTTMILLLLSVFVAAAGKGIIRILAAFIGLYYFAKEISGSNTQIFNNVFSSLLALTIILFGLFVMIKPLFKSSVRKTDFR
ncbi:MAG: hypothetical protein WC879_17645 [Melioribacteraceae bacterium]